MPLAMLTVNYTADLLQSVVSAVTTKLDPHSVERTE